MRYRVHSDLSLGGGKIVPRGIISTLTELRPDVLAILLAQGVVTRAAGPPLTALGETWRARRDKLLPVGIVDLDGLLSVEANVLAKQIRVKADVIKHWQAEAESLLLI